MSQHDFDIANQTAPNARADINLALKALASNSSGTSAPTTTYANMIYYNTATNILYKRNEADSAWIVLGTVDEAAGTFTPSGSLGFTPVQQGGGASQLTNKLYLGWDGIAPRVQVDSSDQGRLVTDNRLMSLIALLSTTGAVGTYAFLGTNFNVTYDLSPGVTYSGTALRWAGVYGNNQSGGYTANAGIVGYGTWRCMGGVVFGAANEYRLTQFIRIA